jgi:hypothetical protein
VGIGRPDERRSFSRKARKRFVTSASGRRYPRSAWRRPVRTWRLNTGAEPPKLLRLRPIFRLLVGQRMTRAPRPAPSTGCPPPRWRFPPVPAGSPACPPALRKPSGPSRRSAQVTLNRSRNSQIAGCTRGRKEVLDRRSALTSSGKRREERPSRPWQRDEFECCLRHNPQEPFAADPEVAEIEPRRKFLGVAPPLHRLAGGKETFRSARTKSRVTPYLPPCMPPALQAMFPPIVL